MRRISDEDLRNLVSGKKIDLRGTRLLRQDERKAESDERLAETEFDHPLIAQGKAIEELVTALGENLVLQNNALARLVDDQIETIRSMTAATTTTVKRKPWKLKVNRNDAGFMESIDILPVDDVKK
jgi:hypothetical protein